MLTSAWIWIRFMQLEGYTLYEVANVICTPDNVRVRCRSSTPHSNGPSVRVVCLCASKSRTLFRCQNNRGVTDNNWTVNAKTLCNSLVVIRGISFTATYPDANAFVRHFKDAADAGVLRSWFRAKPGNRLSVATLSCPSLPQSSSTRRYGLPRKE